MNLLSFALLALLPADPGHLTSLYSRQDPLSLSKQLCFYSEYPDTQEGKKAKERIESMLNIKNLTDAAYIELSSESFNQILAAILKNSNDPIVLSQETIQFIQTLASHSGLIRNKGSLFNSFQELKEADPSEIDVGRGMMILSFEKSPESQTRIQTYEAIMDFMALCIKARLRSGASAEEKVEAINHFIFHELGYRFPAFSVHEAHIDTYTLLPHVLDNRQGVCLGVSLLYYSLAERLGLPLTIYTPPGHIFLSSGSDLNIETTARGIHMPLEAYLSFHIKKVQTRTPKEMLGLSLMNEASVALHHEAFSDAIPLYKKALELIPDDPQILELLGCCYVMNQDLSRARETFCHLKSLKTEAKISSDFIVEDFLNGIVTSEGLKAVFKEVDASIDSLEKKATNLKAVLTKSPRFKAALFQLGTTYLQLHYYEKALEVLEKLYKETPEDPVLVYYLCELSLIRYDRIKALDYQKKLKARLKELGYEPKAAKVLFDEIESLWPAHY